MNTPSYKSPEEQAQAELKERVSLINSLNKGDKLSARIQRYDATGHFSLKMIMNKYGYYDAGLVDEIEWNEDIEKRIHGLNRLSIGAMQDELNDVLREVTGIKRYMVALAILSAISLATNFYQMAG